MTTRSPTPPDTVEDALRAALEAVQTWDAMYDAFPHELAMNVRAALLTPQPKARGAEALKAQVRPLDETLSAFSVLKDEFFPETRSATAICSPPPSGDRPTPPKMQKVVTGLKVPFVPIAGQNKADAGAGLSAGAVAELRQGLERRGADCRSLRVSREGDHERARLEAKAQAYEHASVLLTEASARTVSPVSEGALRDDVDYLTAALSHYSGTCAAEDVRQAWARVQAALPTAEAKPGAEHHEPGCTWRPGYNDHFPCNCGLAKPGAGEAS